MIFGPAEDFYWTGGGFILTRFFRLPLRWLEKRTFQAHSLGRGRKTSKQAVLYCTMGTEHDPTEKFGGEFFLHLCRGVHRASRSRSVQEFDKAEYTSRQKLF